MSLENRVFLHEKEVKTPSENLAINKMCSDLIRIYKAITIPFARKLGKNITVEGAYYLRLKLNGASIPFAGHAMRFYNQRIVQFDGVVNRKAFDIEILEKALNLRELYTFEGKEYIVVNGKAYNLEGKEINKF